MRDRGWRRTLAVALPCGAMLCFAIPKAMAQSSDARTERQGTVDYTLTTVTPEGAARIRGNCASGDMPALLARSREAGLTGLPDVADYCVAALIRLGRDGTLGFLRDTRSAQPMPALSFDTGFVTAFRKRETVTSDLPSMAALKPTVERCLAQNEPNAALCAAAGQIFGARVAQGETVSAQ